jgi:predicted MFS family arabinose efflux permease
MTDGRSGRLRLLQAATCVSVIDRLSITPLLVVIATDMDVSLAAVAAVVSVHFFAYGAMQPLWGLLSDRLGRVRTMRLCLLGAALAGVWSAFAPTIVLLAVGRALAGGFWGAIIPTSLVYVGDTWPPTLRQQPLADIVAATAVATSTAALAAGIVADRVHWRVMFAVTAVLAIVLYVVLKRLPEPQGEARHGGALGPLLAVVRQPWSWVVLSFGFVEGGIVMGLFPYLPTSLQSVGVSASMAGLVAGAYGVGVFAWSRLVKRWVGRRSVPLLASVGGSLMVLGWVGPALGVHVWTVVVAGLLLGGGWAFLHTTLQTWVMDVVPSGRSAAVSLFAACLFLGSAAGAAAAAPLVDAENFTGVFQWAALAALPLTVVIVLARRRYDRRPA